MQQAAGALRVLLRRLLKEMDADVRGGFPLFFCVVFLVCAFISSVFFFFSVCSRQLAASMYQNGILCRSNLPDGWVDVAVGGACLGFSFMDRFTPPPIHLEAERVLEDHVPFKGTLVKFHVKWWEGKSIKRNTPLKGVAWGKILSEGHLKIGLKGNQENTIVSGGPT